MRRTALVVVAACAALLGGAWLVGTWRGPRRGPSASLQDLLPSLAEGRPGAIAAARAAALADWQSAPPHLAAMIQSDHWRLRSAACEIIAAASDERLLPLLLPRASDSDWRVRAAAFDAMSRLGPAVAPPMMNTPLDRRDESLLKWLADRGGLLPGEIGAQLCEAYADARQVEFGQPLAGRCLDCHAGPSPQPFDSAARCAECHGELHRGWAGSAHANSLTHLHLVTVDANTRSPAVKRFDPVRGITCADCHRAADDRAGQPSADVWASGGASCPLGFRRPQPPGESCRRCHPATYGQWVSWQSGPHPRRLDWPPGQIDPQAQGDTRGCSDCHMRPVTGEQGGKLKDHRWAARRDPGLLAEGIDVRLESAGGSDGNRLVRLVLTNLAGHDYPTGAARRAVRLYAGAQGAPELALLATLRPVGSVTPWNPTARTLPPGGTLTVPLVLSDQARVVVYELRYFRNLLDPNLAAVTVLSGRAEVLPDR